MHFTMPGALRTSVSCLPVNAALIKLHVDTFIFRSQKMFATTTSAVAFVNYYHTAVQHSTFSVLIADMH